MTLDCLPFELRRYWDDPAVTDVLVNDETEVWIERSGSLHRGHDLRPGDIGTALQRVLTPLGRRLDRLSPMVDARLLDGTRVCAVIEPIAVGGTCAAFRIFRHARFTVDDFSPLNGHFEGIGSAGESHDAWPCIVRRICESDANILITGRTGSGKSALLGTLASRSDPGERIIVIEDTHELVIDHPHVVRLEARDPTHEGCGSVDLDDLLRTALRLRPDRLVVGEVRGSEALTLVQAMSTGHRRCLATLHANSALDGLSRLDVLALSGAAGWSIADARNLVNSAVDLVVHMERCPGGRRILTQIATVEPSTGRRYDVFSLAR